MTFSKCIYLKVYFRIITWFILNVPCIDQSSTYWRRKCHVSSWSNVQYVLSISFYHTVFTAGIKSNRYPSNSCTLACGCLCCSGRFGWRLNNTQQLNKQIEQGRDGRNSDYIAAAQDTLFDLLKKTTLDAITTWMLIPLGYRTPLSSKHTNEPLADIFLYHNEQLMLVSIFPCRADVIVQLRDVFPCWHCLVLVVIKEYVTQCNGMSLLCLYGCQI